MKNFSIATIAALLLSSACLINADDDDSATSATTNPTTVDPTDATTTVDPTTATSSGAADSSSGTPFTCGWGDLAENDDFDEGYICNGDGEDPDGGVSIDCPADLMEGGDCDEMGITGQGCCDADGNAWFCQDPDGDSGEMEPRVVMEDCG